ncbi:DUF3515 domain-containing protein [Nocardia sp. CC227C]|uniref:DUF3515 domain-containing protein n=1 Tax=Nocardia sp. CC227C TaxID=3044562 RepID=UPI00278BD4E4|nr:DUF3515 domain-containing protein [Nocardia sp. CC227C]
MSKDTHGNETEPTSAEQSARPGDPDSRSRGEHADDTAAHDSDAAPARTSLGKSHDPVDEPDDDTSEVAADESGAVVGESDGPAAESSDTGRSPALIATAVALPIALLVGVIVMAVVARQNVTREPLALGSVPAPGADGPACTALLPALPGDIGDYTTSELVEPAPPATKAWQLPEGGEPIVLRCGLDRPLEFHRASPLQVVNGVNWFAVRDETSGVTSGTWIAVDRGTYIAVTMPDSAGPTPLQEISNAITDTVPAQPLDPGELPN